jgi:hypothetical protein
MSFTKENEKHALLLVKKDNMDEADLKCLSKLESCLSQKKHSQTALHTLCAFLFKFIAACTNNISNVALYVHGVVLKAFAFLEHYEKSFQFKEYDLEKMMTNYSSQATDYIYVTSSRIYYSETWSVRQRPEEKH